MATFLFDNTVFGPVISRRLGESLGINLLPNNRKICNFNCIYCECGPTYSASIRNFDIPSRTEVKEKLESRLRDIKKKGLFIDTITFAGNGEPTLHPEFPEIIDDTIELRDNHLPGTNIAILSNSTLIGNDKIFNALNKVDLNILKLDSGYEDTNITINCPLQPFNLEKTIENLKKFNGNLIIQTLFFKGTYKGTEVNNATPEEVTKWLQIINEIKPESVMIYTIARDTPNKGLQKLDFDELAGISEKVEKLGIKTHISP
jgi:wyosine [tRNA(Phe)-imidazoG37] synthetase (radical SAM superfamily)